MNHLYYGDNLDESPETRVKRRHLPSVALLAIAAMMCTVEAAQGQWGGTVGISVGGGTLVSVHIELRSTTRIGCEDPSTLFGLGMQIGFPAVKTEAGTKRRRLGVGFTATVAARKVPASPFAGVGVLLVHSHRGRVSPVLRIPVGIDPALLRVATYVTYAPKDLPWSESGWSATRPELLARYPVFGDWALCEFP